MKIRRNKNLFEKILNLLLISLLLFTSCFGDVKNVKAESFLKLNFPHKSIVEHLKLDVPQKYKSAWLKAEEGSWGPWLLKQEGFLGRELFWDPKLQEATLLIGWESKSLWKRISKSEINLVQQNFEKIARKETGLSDGNPFPLIYEGELNPQ